MRKKLIAANWKMFTTCTSGDQLAAAIVKEFNGEARVKVAICPPFPYLMRIGSVLDGSPIGLGAQNLYPEKEGAFTGEISPAMLVDVGCRFVILGHSERRHKMGEDDAFINRKVHAALTAGLGPILCIGETLAEREANKTEQVLDTQLTGGLKGVTGEQLAHVTLAYEPVWAIGTGKNATPQQAQDAHAFIRRRVAQLCGDPAAQNLIIQYGGSVKPDNAKTLLTQPDVDGALVGGASLHADQFLAIVKAGVV